ncbi:MAG TPA: SHOCT domain-containing protein [Puia sp.]|jgi:hypothetical protein
MKRLLILLLVPMFSRAQSELPKVDNDTLLTTSGFKAIAGTDIKLGVGTLPSGDFKYISESSRSFAALTRGPRYKPDPVGRKWNGHLFHIKKFRKEGTDERGYTWYVILGGGGPVNYECDIENAIATGEIIVPDAFKPKVAGSAAPAYSPSDELKKLKDLYDSGALTKGEYDSAKKKILAKM